MKIARDNPQGRPEFWRRRSSAAVATFLLAASLMSLVAPVGASANAAQPPMAFEQLPGYVDIARFGSFSPDDIKLEVNLAGALLRLLSSSLEEEDGEFAQLLKSLQGIRVNIYELHDDAKGTTVRINEVLGDLRRQGWEAVVSIREEENLHILVRYDEKSILGLLATFVEPGESIGFVNIVGDFDPAQLGRLAREFNIDGFDALGAVTFKSP